MIKDDGDMQKFQDVALCAAKKAGRILEDGFKEKGNISFRTKDDSSLVTDFDNRAEEAVIEIIQAQFPEHAILAEESGGEIGDEYTWLIDALDGTSNFVMKIPLFSVAVTLLHRREPIVAVVFAPMVDEMYSAVKGGGAYLNDGPMRVSSTESLSDAVLIFNKGRGEIAFQKWRKVVHNVGSKARTIRVFGSSAFEACQVASGRLDGEMNISISPWDSIGPALIVEEAGGKVTNFHDEVRTLGDEDFVVTNGKIHKEVLSLL